MDLREKHQIEREFHDNWARSVDPEELYVHQAFEEKTAIENRFALNFLSPIKGKRILDLGCGLGDAAVYFALNGADVWAIDISPGMVGITKRLAEKHNVSNKLDAQVMVAEELKFPDGHFDLIFGNGILHHVDRTKAAKEIDRVLRPNGKAAFIEPLAYNPVINVYRRLADGVRTPTEKPLRFRDIRRLKRQFPRLQHRQFQFLTLPIFLWFFLSGANPSKVRYWKKIIQEGKRYQTIFELLARADEKLFKVFPPISRLCWNTVILIEKK